MSLADTNSIAGSVNDNGDLGIAKRRGNIMIIGGEIGPHVNVYELFHWRRLKEEKELAAAIRIQRVWRAYAARKHRERLRLRIMTQFGMTYNEFVAKMVGVLSRVRGRYGLAGQSALDFSLKDIEKFMNNYIKFEKLFKSTAVDGRLPRNKMVEFFEGAGLFPTHKEVDGAFAASFTGCEGKGELIFVLGPSTGSGRDEQEFLAQHTFIKDVVHSLSANIGQNRIHVGYVYVSENHRQQFGLTGFKGFKEVDAALDLMQFKAERVKLSAALSTMNEIMQLSSRHGAHRVAIVVSGCCKRRPPTAAAAPTHHSQHPNRLPSIRVSDAAPSTAKRRQSIVQTDLRRNSVTHAAAAVAAAAAATAFVAPAAGHSKDGITSRRRKSSITVPHVQGSIRRSSVASNSGVDISLPATTVTEHKRRPESGAAGGGGRKQPGDVDEWANPLVDGADSMAVRQQLRAAADNNIQVISVGVGDAASSVMSHLQQIATRPDLAMTSSNRRTIDKIRTEITDHVCDKDCPYCRYHAPCAEYTRITSAANHASSSRPSGLYFDETLEVVWTLFPPQGAGVDSVRKSTWMRPIIDEREFHGGRFNDANSIKQNIHKLTSISRHTAKSKRDETNKFNTCLQMVFRAKLQREGKIRMPVGENGVEEVTELKRALELARLYLSN